MSSFLDDSRKELETLIREIREGEITKEKIHKTKSYLKNVKQRIEEETKKTEHFVEEEIEFTPGMEVKIKGTGKTGTILRKAKGNTWMVEAGNIRITMKPNEIYPSGMKDKYRDTNKVEILSTKSLGDAPALNLHLRGLPLKEAMELLEKQMDNAVLHGFGEFSVIHGKGEGIIRTAVHKYLKENDIVKDFYFADPRDGGFGKTIVRLKV